MLNATLGNSWWDDHIADIREDLGGDVYEDENRKDGTAGASGRYHDICGIWRSF